jgi:predicted ATPase
LEQAIVLYDPQKDLRSTIGMYFDPRVLCRSYASWTLWYLGYPDQGLQRTQEAVTLAAGLSHPLSLTETLCFAALFHSLRREWQIARERAEAVMTLATEQGFPYWLADGTIALGEALAEQGQVEEGLAQMQQGLAAFRAIGTELERIGALPKLATAYAKVGRGEEGLSVVAEALALVDKTGVRMVEAELHRLKGKLMLQSSIEKKAEACFLKAIEVAQKQEAKSLELRATVSLACLWQQQGKRAEAHNLLSGVYNWFTEGFDTKDLQEAKALLDELAGEP